MQTKCSVCGTRARASDMQVRTKVSYRLRVSDRRIYTCQDCLADGEYRQEVARQSYVQDVKAEARELWLQANPGKTESDLPAALR